MRNLKPGVKLKLEVLNQLAENVARQLGVSKIEALLLMNLSELQVDRFGGENRSN